MMLIETDDGRIVELAPGTATTLATVPKAVEPPARWYWDERGLVGSVQDGGSYAWIQVRHPEAQFDQVIDGVPYYYFPGRCCSAPLARPRRAPAHNMQRSSAEMFGDSTYYDPETGTFKL